MNCTIRGCPGEYEARERVEVVRAGREDRDFIVVERVPAEVCTVCGDVLFTPETVERLQALRRTHPPTSRTVPLYDFATAEAAVAAEVAVP